MEKENSVFFDFDGTLILKSTLHSIAIHCLKEKCFMVSWIDWLRFIYMFLKYKVKMIPFDIFFISFLTTFKVSNKEWIKWMDEVIWKNYVAMNWNSPVVMDLVNLSTTSNAFVISANEERYVKKMLDFLMLDIQVIGTKINFEKLDSTVVLINHEKSNVLKSICKGNPLVAYGNSTEDIDMLNNAILKYFVEKNGDIVHYES